MQKRTVRQMFMIYCVEQRADGLYQFRNRSYQPLGPAVKIKGIGKKSATAMSVHQRFDKGGIAFWLYSDATNPSNSKSDMANYLVRLARLMKLKVEVA